ncbi:peptide chain release factor 2 [Salmonella bongori]|nr:peptide chain release factor 2 [Salmonella bongori]
MFPDCWSWRSKPTMKRRLTKLLRSWIRWKRNWRSWNSVGCSPASTIAPIATLIFKLDLVVLRRRTGPACCCVCICAGAEARGFKTEVIEESEGEVAGIKSATIKISGEYAYGWLRTETGVHRLVRKSPFDSGGRRHTSFSSAFVYPEVDDDIDIEINPADLRIDVYRASGAGGQHVNRTESAVRITHIPTGIVTQCQNDRSQHKNKDQAMKQMKAKLYELEMQKKNAEKQAMEDNKSDIGWGSQIRSYVLDDSRIKDLRTGVETRNTQAVLDGSLDQFIEASLKAGL